MAPVRFTFDRRNAEHPLEVYRFLRDEVCAERMQFVPLVEVCGATVSERSVSPDQLGAFLIAIFDEWVRHDVGTVLVPEFVITEPAFGYLREGYEKFVRHIDRPMKMIGRLVQRGIPAAVVMKLIAKEDALR